MDLASGTTLWFENDNNNQTYGMDISADGATIRVAGSNASNTTILTGGVELSGTNTIEVSNSRSLRIDGEVSGTGGFNKTGGNTLFLTNNDNSYTGPTTISAGILNVSGSIASSSSITNNSALIFNSGSAQSYGNVISGTGTLTKQGDGVLTLSGANTYGGTTTISGGTIRIAGADDRLPVGTAVSIANAAGATLDLNGLNQEIRSLSGGGGTGGVVTNTGVGPSTLTIHPAGGDNGTFSGQITGDIRLEIVGDKAAPAFGTPRQRLGGVNNTFTGGVLVDGATLLVQADGSLGAVPAAFDAAAITLQNNGTLLNNDVAPAELSIHENRGITLGPGGGALVAGFNTNVTVNSVISGAAGNNLTIPPNNGTMIFTGDNTYAGDTILEAGTLARLQIGNGGTSGTLGTGNVLNNGQLTFNRSDASAYAGDISGTGTVTKQGDGVLTLGGNNSYTGATTVSNGTLNVTGAITSTATLVVQNGATLSGSGFIRTTANSITIASGGTLAPGDVSIITGTGVLELETSSLTFGTGSFWEVNIAGDDNGRLRLDSTAPTLDLSGVSLVAGTTSFNPQTLTAFWILDNVGGTALSGEFANMTATGPGGFLFPETPSGFLDLDGTPFVVFLNANFDGNSLTGGNDIVIFAIPEPSKALLAVIGLLTLLVRRRR